jgi:hypothetical protein
VPPDLLVNDKNSSGVKERERNAGPGFPKVRHTQNDNAEEAKKNCTESGMHKAAKKRREEESNFVRSCILLLGESRQEKKS